MIIINTLPFLLIIGKTLMIENVKLGTNSIEVILCVTVNFVSYHLWELRTLHSLLYHSLSVM